MNLRRDNKKFIYAVNIKFDVSSISSDVKTKMSTINDVMHSFGFTENAVVMSEYPLFNITSNIEFSNKEIQHLIFVLHEVFKDNEITKDWEVLSITQIN